MAMHNHVATAHGRMVAHPAIVFGVGGSNPYQANTTGGVASMYTRPGFEPPTTNSVVCCTTTRLMPVMVHLASPLLGSKSATDENPNYVFLSNRT